MVDKTWTENGIDHGFIGDESEYTRMTDGAVRKLARDIIEGRAFGSWQIPPNAGVGIEQLFIPLMLFDLVQTKRFQRDGVTHLYEYTEKALPMRVNGYPMFHSFHCLDKQDFDRVMRLVGGMDEALEGVI